MKYSVMLRDTDPDTGATSQIIKMCDCDSERTAHQIREALSMQDDSNPNREYLLESYAKRENLIVCIDPDELEEAWRLQIWLKQHGVRAVVCFSEVDLEMVRSTFIGYGIPHALMIVGAIENWKGVNFDLHISQLDPLDFESIIRSLK